VGRNPVYWVLDFENPVTKTYARTHLTEMIERDRNRASVVIWSVGNENEGNDTQTALRRDLAQLARDLDPTRLISAACFVRMTRGDDGTLNGLFVDDPFGAYADILAINEYIGWYHDHTNQLSGVPVQTAWDKPLLFSEFGAGVKQGLRGTSEEVWTEEFGARFYQDQYAWCDELKRAGVLQGTSPWILRDFRSPRRPLGEVQDWYNRKGLISEHGLKKDVFFVVQEWHRRWASE
jgi:beta-glucuronidase